LRGRAERDPDASVESVTSSPGRWVLALGFAAACYREQAPTVRNTADQALVLGAPLVCGPDDRRYPAVDGSPDSRMRSHGSGALTARHRTWLGPAVPEYVPERIGTLGLFLLDEVEGGHLAFYREPYNLGSCGLGNGTNCTYEARLYGRRGEQRWALQLGEVMSRPDQLEIQDIRLAGGVLYFNEACQSYSSGANGKCSSLVAVDPKASRVLWRTPPLVSNGRFLVRGCYIVAGYGFTGEPDAVSVIDRGSGKVLQTIPVSSAPEQYTLREDDGLDVRLYSNTTRQYRMRGFDGGPASLESLDPDEDIYGGTTYGGASYGGAPYGGHGRP